MKKIFAIFFSLLALGSVASASQTTTDESKLLVIFLEHDQRKNLAEIQDNLTHNKFYEVFPPTETAILDWHVVMGIGQIVTIETPTAKLGEVKNSLNKGAFGGYKTECFEATNKYPTVSQVLSNKEKTTLEENPVKPGEMLLTVILKPNKGIDTQKTVADQKLYESFPPPKTTVINWYEAKGLGDIVTLKFPAELLRAVNLSLEKFAWKAYETDFYSTYDFYPSAKDTFKLKNLAKKSL